MRSVDVPNNGASAPHDAMADSELARSTIHSTTDRRGALRHVRIIQAVAVEDDSVQKFGPGWLARILNISTTGIGMHLGDFFPVGTVLTLGLRNPGTERSLPPKHVRIVRNDEQDNGTWVVGAEFFSELSEEELNLILE